jgi:biotin carboxylase
VRDVLGLLDDDVARQVGRRLAVMDKLAASRLFDGAGVRTPPVVSASEAASPGAAAATLGLPMVLKRRVGCGGDSVSITHTVASAIEAAARWDDDHDHYYEAYVDGEKLNYAAAVSARGIEQELTYRVSRWVQPVGTATEIETIDDPDLVALGRRAIEASGCTGLMNLDVIRDDDGRCWLIDFNARAFGGGANFLTVGLDVSEGYLAALGHRAEPPARRSVAAASRIDVFPTSLRDPRNKGSMLRMAGAFLGESMPYLRALGARYWLSEALRAPEAAAANHRRRRSRSRGVVHAH